MIKEKKVLLRGIAASVGIAIGKVKIINSPAEVEKMNEGDNLRSS